MKKIIYILLTLFILNQSSIAETFLIPNPQGLMTGARQLSLGGTPTLLGDISGVLINPAVVGDISELTFSVSSQKIMNEFDYFTLNFGHTVDLNFKQDNIITNIPIGFAVSVGSITLNDIPRTVEYYGFPQQTDSYNAGYNIVEASVATTLYDQFSFDILNFSAIFSAVVPI